jgi:hypothetical protein
MSMASNTFHPIRLTDEDQLALLGLMLAIMNADLSLEEDDEKRRAREAARGLLRMKRRDAYPDGKGAEEPLDIENRVVLDDRLRAVDSPGHSLLILASTMAYEPWAQLHETNAGRVNRDARRQVIQSAAVPLPGRFHDDVADDLEGFIWPSMAQRAMERMGPREWWAVGGMTIVGVATAGIAAPWIGAAIGGAMGLEGAAAGAAGLAAMGGGAVAGGGLGMAGGTAMIGALGGLGGGTLAAMYAQAADRAQVEVETRVLRAFVHVAHETGAATALEARRIEAALECEIANLIAQRAREAFDGSPQRKATAEELSHVVDLRRTVSPIPFEITS